MKSKSKGMRIVLFLVFNLLYFAVEGQVTFIIESLPNTTPEEDTIFITGTFNNWKVNDKNYMLHPRLDGKYSITLQLDTNIIEFKFCRGSWLKVETNEQNEYIPNRVFEIKLGKVYNAKIVNWQDLGGVKKFNYIVLLLFALAFYGFTLLAFAIRLQIKFNYFISWFFPINSCIIFLLIGGVLYNQANLIWQSHIGMLGIVVLYIWGPFLYLFLNSLKRKISTIKPILQIIPAVLVLTIAFLRFFNFRELGFYAEELNPKISRGSSILITLGIFLNLIYHILAFKLLKYTHDATQRKRKGERLIKLMYLTSTAALIILSVNFISILSDTFYWQATGFDLVLIVISIIIFIEFYYYWKYPEIFQKRPNLNYQLFEKTGNFDEKAANFFSSGKYIHKVAQPGLPDDLAKELRIRVIEQMKDKKVYKNQTLNIAGLSELIETKPHILSKLLNEEFNKSFRDFINEYRIKEFIELASSVRYKNYTLLALSYEVGFNSKSTFNLAFKKEMGMSPSNYLKNNKITLGD